MLRVSCGIALLVLVSAGCFFRGNFSSSRSMSISGSGEDQVVTVKIQEGPAEREFQSKGRVELSSDDKEVVAVSRGGHLRIKEQTPDGSRDIEFQAAESGEPKVVYRVDGAAAELDGEGREWLARMLDFVVHETPIAAGPRAERILGQSGPDALLQEIQVLKSGAAQGIYFEVLLASADPGTDLLVKAAQVAARHVSSSSTLRDILSEIAAHQTDDEAVSLAIIEASEAINSDSRRAQCLQKLAELRSMTAAVATAAMRSAAKLTSNSSKRDALVALLSAAPADSEVLLAYVEAAQSISSTNRQSETLIAVLNKDGVDATVLTRVAEAAGKIPSSSTQEEVLIELIRMAPSDAQVFDATLAVVARMSSTSSQEDVLEALLERPDLQGETLRRAADVIQGISSRHARENLEQLVTERLAE